MAEKGIKIIDFRDSLSSISLLKVSLVFGRLAPSEVLEIRGVDSAIRQDLFKVLPQAAYEVVAPEEKADREWDTSLRIRKRV